MSWQLTLALYGAILAFCLLGGVTIGASMGLVGIVGISLVSGFGLWSSLGDVVFSQRAAARQLVEDAGKAICQRLKHLTCSYVRFAALPSMWKRLRKAQTHPGAQRAAGC